jgi:urocanate hydratase
MVLDGTDDASKIAKSLLFWDVNNGLSRRSWAYNDVQFLFNYFRMQKKLLKKLWMKNLY